MGSSVQYEKIRREKNKCRTPGAVYETALRDRAVRLDVYLPVSMIEAVDHSLLIDELHKAVLPVMENLFKKKWSLLAGKKLPGDRVALPDSWEELW